MLRFAHAVSKLSGRALAAIALVLPAVGANAASTPLLYEVRSDNNTVYLFGTVHVGARKMYPLSAPVQRAFSTSKALALEADPGNSGAIGSVTAGSTYRAPETIERHISPELYAQLKSTLPSVGLPIEYARAMRPHMLAMTLVMMEIGREGYDPSLGLDMHLARAAREQGKRIIELESLADQMALLDSFGPDVQEAMLRATLDSLADGSMKVDLRELVKAWMAGDGARLLAQVEKESNDFPPEIAEQFKSVLYDQRNAAMTDRIVRMLKARESVFVAVGTGHLLGPTGLVEALRRRGYEVKEIGRK